MIQIEREEVVSGIKYIIREHGKPMAREMRQTFHAMARPKTERDKLETKVNEGLRRKHGKVVVITGRTT